MTLNAAAATVGWRIEEYQHNNHIHFTADSPERPELPMVIIWKGFGQSYSSCVSSLIASPGQLMVTIICMSIHCEKIKINEAFLRNYSSTNFIDHLNPY